LQDYDVGLDRVLKRIEENTTAEKFGAAEQQMELIYRELAFYLAIAPKPTLHAMVLKSFQTGSLSSIEVCFSSIFILDNKIYCVSVLNGTQIYYQRSKLSIIC
jgi:hypothetical protein